MTSRTHPLVSIVILSYNRPGYLRKALGSILEQTYENLEIIVVDNESGLSKEVASVVGGFKGVRLIRNHRNLGYAGGMNRGLQAASGLYVYLTEDDIVLETDCILRLVEFIESRPLTGLAAPIIYNERERTILCAGGDFALSAVYQRKNFGAGEVDTGQFQQPFDVSYIPGASVFARLEFLKQLKGFREEFFMYVEDVELCARVLKSGRKISVVPQARVYHFEPPERMVSTEIEFHKQKNFFTLYLLHAPARSLPGFICRYALWNTLRSMLARGRSTRTSLAALLWVMRKAPSLLKERYSSKARLQLVSDIEST